MWKVSFKDPKYKKVQKFNDKVTVVTLKGDMKIPIEVTASMPKDVYGWMEKKSNPKVKCYPWNSIIGITATGKAVRSKEDKDDPVLAERIAECRAKIAIFGFIAQFTQKYLNCYKRLMVGKNGFIATRDVQKESIYGINERYCILWMKEQKHLKELLKEHD